MRLLLPFRRRDFALLWVGQAASLVGDGIFTVAITFQVLELDNSAGALSLVLLVAAGTFGISALCVLALRARSYAGAEREGALRELAAGWRYVRSQPWLYATLAASALAVLFIIGPFQVLLPYVIRNELGGDAE